jgi:hypothetical protein
MAEHRATNPHYSRIVRQLAGLLRLPAQGDVYPPLVREDDIKPHIVAIKDAATALLSDLRQVRRELDGALAELARERVSRQQAQREMEQAQADRNKARMRGEVDARRTLQPVIDRAVAAEREACIDLVAFHGGPVDLEAAIRARGGAGEQG